MVGSPDFLLNFYIGDGLSCSQIHDCEHTLSFLSLSHMHAQTEDIYFYTWALYIAPDVKASQLIKKIQKTEKSKYDRLRGRDTGANLRNTSLYEDTEISRTFCI